MMPVETVGVATSTRIRLFGLAHGLIFFAAPLPSGPDGATGLLGHQRTSRRAIQPNGPGSRAGGRRAPAGGPTSSRAGHGRGSGGRSRAARIPERLLGHTIPARARPAQSMATLKAAIAGATAWRSDRGEAEDAARQSWPGSTDSAFPRSEEAEWAPTSSVPPIYSCRCLLHAHLLPDGGAEGQLSGRVHGRAHLLGDGHQGPGSFLRLPGRADGDLDPPA